MIELIDGRIPIICVWVRMIRDSVAFVKELATIAVSMLFWRLFLIIINQIKKVCINILKPSQKQVNYQLFCTMFLVERACLEVETTLRLAQLEKLWQLKNVQG